MSRLKYVFPLLLIMTSVYGCASNAAFTYTPGPDLQLNEEKKPLKVAVLPFKDSRSERNKNAAMLYLIPVVPYGYINYDRPDAANGFMFHSSYNFRPAEDFAKALVEELKINNLFDEVFFTERESEPGVDLYLVGEITDTSYNAKLLSYGLSIYGPALWLIGAPAGTTENTLSLNLSLKRASDDEIVWSHSVEGEWGKVVGLYYNWAADFEGYPAILKSGLQDGIRGLARDLELKDVGFWNGRATQSESAVAR